MMQEIVIDSENNMQRILGALDQGGHSQVACVSNAGMKIGLVRVTILPNSAFLSDRPKMSNADWMEAFRGAADPAEIEDGASDAN